MEPEHSLRCSQKRATTNPVSCGNYAELNLWGNCSEFHCWSKWYVWLPLALKGLCRPHMRLGHLPSDPNEASQFSVSLTERQTLQQLSALLMRSDIPTLGSDVTEVCALSPKRGSSKSQCDNFYWTGWRLNLAEAGDEFMVSAWIQAHMLRPASIMWSTTYWHYMSLTDWAVCEWLSEEHFVVVVNIVGVFSVRDVLRHKQQVIWPRRYYLWSPLCCRRNSNHRIYNTTT